LELLFSSVSLVESFERSVAVFCSVGGRFFAGERGLRAAAWGPGKDDIVIVAPVACFLAGAADKGALPAAFEGDKERGGMFAVVLLLSPHQFADNFQPMESLSSGEMAVLVSRLAAPVVEEN
jgi:hypothetical protein